MAQIGAIYTAPVKSFALNRHNRVDVDFHGISEDRRFYVIDGYGQLLTQREKGELTQIRAHYEEDENRLTLKFPDGNKVSNEIIRETEVVTRIWGRHVRGHKLQGAWTHDLSEFCGEQVSLVISDKPGELYDEYPVSLLSSASLALLQKESGWSGSFDETRFRPTLLVDDCEAHEEDSWIGKIICIGDHLKIAVISRDPRCAIITHDPVTGLPDTDTLSIIRSYRKNLGPTYFGVYGSVVQSGSVSVGTDVILL